MAYEQLTGPLDPGRRGDYHAAQVAAAVYNVHRGNRSPVSVDDLVLRWDHEPKSPQDLLAIAQRLNTQWGGATVGG